MQLVAEGTGDSITVVFHPTLFIPAESAIVPRIDWPVTYPLPPASADTMRQALEARHPEFVKMLPAPRGQAPEASRFGKAVKAADDAYAAGRYEEAMKGYEEAAQLPPADLAKDKAAQQRTARLDAVRCLVKLGRLDEAASALDGIEKERPSLGQIHGADEWETQDARNKAGGWWQHQFDGVRWMILDAREGQRRGP
jgi:tetratricopeptide (TPR) repeat protein